MVYLPFWTRPASGSQSEAGGGRSEAPAWNRIRAVDVEVHMPKIGKTAVHWLLEGFFIVVSVGLGFGVAQYRESLANHELAVRVKNPQVEVRARRWYLAAKEAK